MKTLQHLSILLLVILFASCKDITEPNVSKKIVNLLAPSDHDTLISSTVNFWWDKIDEKDTYTYRIQIAKPSFSNPQQLVLDSTTNNNIYTDVLSPGKYEWRIRVENNSSASDYTTRSFVIDSTQNIATQVVSLISPTTNVNSLNVTFNWNAVSNATEYYLNIKYPDNTSTTFQGITTPSVNKTFTQYGHYQWRVQALNSQSNTQYSPFSSFDIVMKSPNALTSLDSVTAPTPIVLSWNNFSPADGDTVFVYKDNLTSSPIIYTPVLTSVRSYTFTTSTAGISGHNYYWTVKSYTNNGDTSSRASTVKFKVK